MAIRAASLLETTGRIPAAVEVKPKIKWLDGLPEDEQEAATIEQTRKNSGLTSNLSAIMRLDHCTEEEAQKELDRIKQDTPATPPRADAGGPRGGNRPQNNGPDGQVDIPPTIPVI